MNPLFAQPHEPLELRYYQREAIDAAYNHLRKRKDNPCVVLPTGCHEIDHPILMFDGSIKAVQDVKPGECVMGPDSLPRTVQATCRGQQEMVRISPTKGESFVVNVDHMLQLICTNEGKGKYPSQKRGGETESVTVGEWGRFSKYKKHLRKLYRVPIEFKESSHVIPPYIMGVLLGDGSMSDGVVEVTSVDSPIVDEWSRFAESIGCKINDSTVGGRCPTYTAVGTATKRGNPIINELRLLSIFGLGCGEKYIPESYLIDSRENRLDLLAGLVDTDGAISRSGFDFISKSKQLSVGVVRLCRSLGLAAYLKMSIKKSQNKTEGVYWRVSISGNCDIVPVRLKRKQCEGRKQKKNHLVTSFIAEPIGQGNFYGFTLDGDHLYVDGHFMVHHNSGKTPVMATVCNDVVTRWDGRVLVLAHVKELVEQTADTISRFFPSLKVGVYSAGLGRRETRADVLVAGIQSVHNKGLKLTGSDPFKLVLVDEAHRIPTSGDGMYRNLLSDLLIANDRTRVMGLTATPYRMKGGWVCGPDHFLNEICYEAGVRELIAKGYLCPLVSKQPRHAIDSSAIKIKGGEFESHALSAAFDSGDVVDMAVAEIAEQTGGRKSVLIFCCDVAHAEHVSDAIAMVTDQACGIVTGDMAKGDRARAIEAFKMGRLKYLVNVNVLTEGFDARQVDCVVLLRSTLSPGLYYQVVGRGLRTHEAKSDCLVLDFGGNVLRHGCVDAIKIKSPRGASDADELPSRICPECQEITPAFFKFCRACGFEFPRKEDERGPNHESTADEVPITSDHVRPVTYEVSEIAYAEHTKRGADEDAPKTMRVTYYDGLQVAADEWVCVEHSGFGGERAAEWWQARTDEPMPDTAAEAAKLARLGYLAEPVKIDVIKPPGQKFARIVKYWLGEKPDPNEVVEVSDDDDGEVPF